MLTVTVNAPVRTDCTDLPRGSEETRRHERTVFDAESVEVQRLRLADPIPSIRCYRPIGEPG
jgi:hypothetical protein